MDSRGYTVGIEMLNSLGIGQKDVKVKMQPEAMLPENR